MKKIGIYYGSSTGTTSEAAEKIAKVLGVTSENVFDVAKTAPSSVADYDLLVLGTSTWGSGDIQDDMSDFLDGLSALDLEGKEIGLFGCGDEGMSETFCDGVGEMYERLKGTNAKIIGEFPAACYDYRHSRAILDGAQAVGLLLDEVNHPNLSDERIEQWCKLISK